VQAQARKAEQHMRRQLATERAEMQADFDRQRTAWQQKLDKAAELEQRVAKGKDDPIALLEAHGYDVESYEAIAHLLYSLTPEGQKDPKRKAAALAALKERKSAGSVADIRRELDEFKKSQAEREEQAQVQARIDAYAGAIAKAAGDATPLAKAALAKNPERTQQRLLVIADRLYMESGPSNDLRDVPKPAEVLAAYEKERAAELEELGIDPKTIGRGPAATNATAAAAATNATTTAAANTAQPNGAPPKRRSREELLAGIKKIREANGTT
jgi:hypothetical protein